MFLKCILPKPAKYDVITWLTVERENLNTPVRTIMYVLRLTKIIPYILNVEEFEKSVKIIKPPLNNSEENFYNTFALIEDYEEKKLIDIPKDLKPLENEPLFYFNDFLMLMGIIALK